MEDCSWLQAKCASQAAALDRLHSTVVRQRFVLRITGELGHVPSKEEFIAARDAINNEQTRERIGEPV
jgi:hypothetical protein